MDIEVWSDVGCPWSYVGRAHLLEALDSPRVRAIGQVAVRWRAFELLPELAAVYDGSFADRLRREYDWTDDQVVAYEQDLAAQAAAVGGRFRFDILRMANTFDAHRLIALAGTRGLAGRVKQRLADAYFGEGLIVSDREVLEGLAVEAGLEPMEVRAALESGAFAEQVRDDERRAKRLGITQAPTFLIDETILLVGAQPTDALIDAILDAAQGSRADGDVGVRDLSEALPPARSCTAESCIV
ncbi:MAG: DsbA family oxidoreductase [Microbacteriaceae bacterium]